MDTGIAITKDALTYDEFKGLMSSVERSVEGSKESLVSPASKETPEEKPVQPAERPTGKRPPRPVEPPLPALDSLQTLDAVFYGIGRHLGIGEAAARPVAFYVSENYDLGDAAKVWEGLRECPAVMPAQRCMWWQTWVNRQRLPLSGEIAERVFKEIQEIRSTAL